MAVIVTRFPNGRVAKIAAAWNTEIIRINLLRKEAQERMAGRLYSLSKEELFELAEMCGEETGPDHCLYCEAWDIYQEWHETDAALDDEENGA